MANIALVDDHVLLRNGLEELVTKLGYTVLFGADNGEDFITKLNPAASPDLVLMDIMMPLMDGYATAQWIKENHPEIKVLALSMYDKEVAIIRMLRSGASGYILKDCDPSELKAAVDSVLTKGYYYSDLVSGRLIHAINTLDNTNSEVKSFSQLNERETDFLKYCCTELTYKEIADKMFVSPRTIDGYRDALFEKLNVKTRVGLVLYAVKSGIVNV